MPSLLQLPDVARFAPRQYGFFDDFQGFLTADSTAYYTVVTAVDGTALLIDAAQGGVAIKSAAATAGNEDCYLVREPEAFKLAADKSLAFEALVQATEDDTNQNNLFVGLTDGAAADLLVNDGAGPKTSGNSLAFYKVDGGLNWWVHARDDGDTTVLSAELTATNSLDGQAHVGSGSAKQRLSIEVIPKGGSLGDILYSIDGVPVYLYKDFALSGNTDMQCVCGAKDGDSADEVTINLYYWYCYQLR